MFQHILRNGWNIANLVRNGRVVSRKSFLTAQSAKILAIRAHYRHFSTSNEEPETIKIAHGPKDTILMTGYNVRENEMESHIKTLKEALKLKLMTLKFYSEDIAQSFTDLAMCQHQSLLYINEAKDNYLNAYEIWKKIRGEKSREVANILNLIGVFMRDLGDVKAAKSALKESLEIDKSLGTAMSYLCSVYSLNNLAGIADLEGEYQEACNYYEDALKILLTATGGDANHRLISVLYYNMACSYHHLNDDYNAEIALNRSRDVIANIGDPCNILHRVEELLDIIKKDRQS
ncbi:conserved hypothetical protein [Theileria equi strain WA]|uniref:Uncharacterized protein n=1 Tax=Theileria equi strain WA TaxID=1537102 RepID=L1LF34_THEEQ|nr:conserved hypothetical protein [Theileria equi strain WA]EKX73966.1 conserved hypothetical protein [Theileria equi strain WA]|eukprot:XP_004833418.1 conserved hypothetical protein [Theileria equi strain WA]